MQFQLTTAKVFKVKAKAASAPCQKRKKRMLKKNPLLDKFCVRDAFYHELSMITDGLPRSNLMSSNAVMTYTKCAKLTHQMQILKRQK